MHNSKTAAESLLENVGDMTLKRRARFILGSLMLLPSSIILDCGCGEGFYLTLLRAVSDSSCLIVGVDLDHDLLVRAKRRLSSGGNVELIRCDVTYLPFKEAAIDELLVSEVLEHVAKDNLVLGQLRSVLKQDGKMVLTVPNHNYPFLWDPINKALEHYGLSHFRAGLLGGQWAMHRRLYLYDELIQIVRREGYDVEEVRGLTHWGFPFNYHILYLLKLIHDSVPLPTSVSKSMDKFAWQPNESEPRSNLLRLIYLLLNMFDRRNDSVTLSQSCMTIALRAKRT